MALIFILKCDHFSGMETKQTLVKERTEHVPYAAIIFLDLIHLLVFFYIYDALGRSSKSVSERRTSTGSDSFSLVCLDVVCYTAVFCVVTQRSSEEHCVTKTAV